MVEPTSTMEHDDHYHIAAVDLGSNSFHLIVAQVEHGRIFIVDKIKEMVRLAAGLDDHSRLHDAAIDHAVRCLQRFGQRLRHIARDNIRIVGTNTLRKARNRDAFITRAEAALGHPIEIIAGREEARLIYLGVSHTLEDVAERRLVVDIGGGSTEIILGKRFSPELMESLFMGCVGMSQAHFPNGKIRPQAYAAAKLAACRELEPIQQQFRDVGFDIAIGASGTVLAARDVLAALGASYDTITSESLQQLEQRIIACRHTSELALPGLPRQREDVFPGGVAILSAVLQTFGIQRLRVSEGALREGLLYDLMGRFYNDDIRDSTVTDLMRRYHVDRRHAQRVRDTVIYLLLRVCDAWQLDPEDQQLLGWAALLHEIGLDIAHTQYHKHGGYLLQHMDMPGFSRSEQQRLALLVRAHRRKFPTTELKRFPEALSHELTHLSMLLRLAVVLHRNRSDEPQQLVQADASPSSIRLLFPKSFLAHHPLTDLDLREEANYLRAAGIELTYADEIGAAVAS